MNKPRNNLRNLKIIVYCIVEGINNVTETKMLRGLSKDQQKYCFKIFPSHPDVNHMYSLAVSKASLCKKDDFVAILIDSDPVSNPARLSNIITANEKNKNKRILFLFLILVLKTTFFHFFKKHPRKKIVRKWEI